MDFSMIFTSIWFRGAVAIVAVAIGVWLIGKLHQIFFCKFQFFFSRNAYLDKEIEGRLNQFAWGWAILLPIWLLSSTLWIKAVQNPQWVCGISFGIWGPAAYLIVNLLFLVCNFRLVSFFFRCYRQQQSNAQRPIRAIVTFFYVLLVVWGLMSFGAALTMERPLILLSTLGAAAAIFIFAFQNLISSLIANFHINAEKMVKVGDWIVIKSKGIDGIVESISAVVVKVRGWDMSQVSFPVRLLLDETFVNYQVMIESGARRIERSLLIDQRSIRFLSADEVAELKKLHLVTDEMLKKADAFPETDDLAGVHCWTNVELFTLYAEDYLHRRPDIRHDVWCMVRAQNPTSQGMALELFCFATQTPIAQFAPIQRSILYHLLAVLPSFRLRVFQECSDIYQEIGNVPDKIGSAFRYDQLKDPIYPSDRR